MMAIPIANNNAIWLGPNEELSPKYVTAVANIMINAIRGMNASLILGDLAPLNSVILVFKPFHFNYYEMKLTYSTFSGNKMPSVKQ